MATYPNAYSIGQYKSIEKTLLFVFAV